MEICTLICEPRGKSKPYICPDLLGTDWAYIAGILDGEGCLHYNKKKNGKLYPKISVGNTHKGLCEWLQMILGGGFYFQDRSDRKNWNDAWMWVQTSGAAVYTILSKCLPYLIIKKNKAIEILQLLSKRLGD